LKTIYPKAGARIQEGIKQCTAAMNGRAAEEKSRHRRLHCEREHKKGFKPRKAP